MRLSRDKASTALSPSSIAKLETMLFQEGLVFFWDTLKLCSEDISKIFQGILGQFWGNKKTLLYLFELR